MKLKVSSIQGRRRWLLDRGIHNTRMLHTRRYMGETVAEYLLSNWSILSVDTEEIELKHEDKVLEIAVWKESQVKTFEVF